MIDEERRCKKVEKWLYIRRRKNLNETRVSLYKSDRKDLNLVCYIAKYFYESKHIDRLLKLALKYKADINHSISKYSPLIYSVSACNHDSIRSLISFKANINCSVGSLETSIDLRDKPPLLLAISKNDMVSVRLLIDSKADIQTEYVCDTIDITRDTQILEYFIDIGLIPYKMNALLWCDDFYVCLKFIKSVVSFNGYSEETKTKILMKFYPCKDILQKLLEKGLDVNTKNKKGQTLLYLSVVDRKYDIIKLLREYNPNINMKYKLEKENKYMNIFEIAMYFNSVKSFGILLNFKGCIDKEIIDKVIQSDNERFICKVIDREYYGIKHTVRMCLATNAIKCVCNLLKRDYITDNVKTGVLDTAVMYNRTKIVKLLITSKGDPLHRNDNGCSALSIAISKKKNDIAKYIIDKCNMNLDDLDHYLFICKKKKNVCISDCLLDIMIDKKFKL